MRRLWLVLLLALPMMAGATAGIPTRAQAQDVFGLVTAPLRIMRNLGVRGRLFRHRHRARPAAAPSSSRGAEHKREAAREGGRETTVATAGYWPEAYDDMIGFAFAPGRDEQFWTHGPFDLLTAALMPSATTRASRRAAKAKPEAPDPCADGSAREAAASAYRNIEARVEPTAAQRAAFDTLRDAMTAAARRIDAACAAGYATARPPERMAVLADRLSAARYAMLTIRTPLEAAYATLSDEQKAALDGPAPQPASCAADLAAAGAWPTNEIMRALSPNDAQQAALEKLRLTFLGMSQNVAAACPKQPLTTALARLDAAGERLNAMLYAARVINRALTGAYATLDNEQKARLQLVGRSLRIGVAARAADLGTR